MTNKILKITTLLLLTVCSHIGCFASGGYQTLERVTPDAKIIFEAEVTEFTKDRPPKKSWWKRLFSGKSGNNNIKTYHLKVTNTKSLKGAIPPGIKKLNFVVRPLAFGGQDGRPRGWRLSPASGKENNIKKGEKWIFFSYFDKPDVNGYFRIFRAEPITEKDDILKILSQQNDAQPKKSPRFAIFLVDADDNKIKRSQSELMQAELSKEPLLTEKDIVHYKWTNHSFKLTKNATARLQNSLKGKVSTSGLPFVVAVDGEKCFAGYFMTKLSSVAITFDPVILIDDLITAKNDVILRFQYGYPTGLRWRMSGVIFSEEQKKQIRQYENKTVRKALIELGKLSSNKLEIASANLKPYRLIGNEIQKFVVYPLSPSSHFKDFKVTRKDFIQILKQYYCVSREHWLHGYHHISLKDGVSGYLVMKNGEKVKWLVKPDGLAWLEFADGKKIFLAKDLTPYPLNSKGIKIPESSSDSEAGATPQKLQYRTAGDAGSPSRFIAVLPNGSQIPFLKINWKIGDSKQKSLRKFISQLEKQLINGKEFRIKAKWVRYGVELDVYDIEWANSLSKIKNNKTGKKLQ